MNRSNRLKCQCVKLLFFESVKMVYTSAEMTDMHFVYGLSNGNSLEASRKYAEMYPQRVAPHHTLFPRIHQRLRETGTFVVKKPDCGRQRDVRTPALEEAVLDLVDEQPEISTRRIALQLNVNHMTVFSILKEHLLYPYHIQRVQALLPRDFPNRLEFCDWMLGMIEQIPEFLKQVLFTDEANFSRESIINYHNNHLWSEENPHAITEAHHQQHFSLNVWVGCIGNLLIGPYFLPPRLNGETYCQFLREELPSLLDNVLIGDRMTMWFMHDGAPAHFSIGPRQYLNEAYPNRWIGRGGFRSWPARSPDLNPLDFCIWGHLKTLVYKNPVEDVEDLRNRIIASCRTIQETPGIFDRIRESMRRRLHSCIVAGGGHFQHLI